VDVRRRTIAAIDDKILIGPKRPNRERLGDPCRGKKHRAALR